MSVTNDEIEIENVKILFVEAGYRPAPYKMIVSASSR
jgi:hypothetical protein